ncbi:MAG: pyridoxine 5'-phosphate synthase [Nitrospirae bacterium]|nr:pyridoxine 5'-phosphate synthase [Nitrospirota bacterium]MBI3595450.1 pyridoxine 5'-phosphate synthase [Nitrospirota bacterium]
MAKLGVNIDHIATLRQARGGMEPDPVTAVAFAELGGADSIVVHLREDRRHIQERDVKLLKEVLQIPLDLEAAATEEMIALAVSLKPQLVTFVPEKRKELTTEGGLDILLNKDSLKNAVDFLHDCNIPVSLFIDPDMEQLKMAHKINADKIEIHTGQFAQAEKASDVELELKKITQIISMSAKLGLGINAGHGLNYRNIIPLTKLAGIEEFNIGHSIISRAIFIGLKEAVSEMKKLVNPPEKV